MNSLIFNEISVPFDNYTSACEGLELFVSTWIQARQSGFTEIRLPFEQGNYLYSLDIAPGYNISKLLNSDMSNCLSHSIFQKDLKDRFKDIMTSSPFIADSYTIKKKSFERSEFTLTSNGGNISCIGLGVGWILETLCISFLSHDRWKQTLIKLSRYYIDEEGNEHNDLVTSKNISIPDHLLIHQEWVDNIRKIQIAKSRDLWERRVELFPHLIFCGEVEKQFSQIGRQSKYFDQIIEKLKGLNKFAGDYAKGKNRYSDQEFKQYGLNVSGESISTMSKYGNYRRFRLPEGGRESFEKHIKAGDLRFHFFINQRENKIYVGYIGAHLPIISG